MKLLALFYTEVIPFIAEQKYLSICNLKITKKRKKQLIKEYNKNNN